MNRFAVVSALFGLLDGLLILLILMALFGCTAPPEKPQLVTTASAEEFDSAPPQARKYRPTLTRESRLVWGINAPIPALAAQIHQESNWQPDARSGVGAGGLAQFMPATARDFPDDAGQVDVYNPDWSLRAQSRYMLQLHGTVSYPAECDRYGAALSAYNGGLGWHNKRQRLAPDPTDFWQSVRPINPGVTDANQKQNFDYPEIIVYHRQVVYRTWGATVCSI